jgi:hypothetical protein
LIRGGADAVERIEELAAERDAERVANAARR